jgi:hypothetical protein
LLVQCKPRILGLVQVVNGGAANALDSFEVRLAQRFQRLISRDQFRIFKIRGASYVVCGERG